MRESIAASMRCALGIFIFLASTSLATAATPALAPVLKQSPDVITKPTLIAPEENALLPDGLVTFQWTAATGPQGYPFEYLVTVSQDGTTVREFDTWGTSFTLEADEALPPDHYSWLVRAVNASGVSVSPEASFTVTDGTSPDGGAPDAGTIGPGPGGQNPGGPLIIDPVPPPSAGTWESSGCAASPTGAASHSTLLPLLVLGLALRATSRRRSSPSRLADQPSSLE